MDKEELFLLLQERFGSRNFWPELQRQLRGWPTRCLIELPEVIGDGQVEKMSGEDGAWQYNLAPFLSAVKEVEQLRKMCLELGDETQLRQKISERVVALKDFSEISEYGGLIEDLVWFAEKLLPVSVLEKVVTDACWVKDQNSGVVSLYVGAELNWLLMVSRCLGLISLKTLDRLRSTKIRALGASVAASTLDLLASLGCEDIVCADAGVMDPSNLPRLPMATVQNLGCPKSQALIAHLLRRNPYGKFRAVVGKVVPTLTERKTAQDVTVSEFIKDADVILEVVDDIWTKVFVQTVALKEKPNTPLIFIADLGVDPVVKVVKAGENKPFGKAWSEKEFAQLTAVLNDPSATPLSAYLMVKEDLPADHAFQFLMSCIGVMPFWSQTPVASRSSAAMGALAVLEELLQS